MATLLEFLPAEIFSEVFDYLTAYDLLYAFINLNGRMNNIVGKYPLQLNLQDISRKKFDFICRHIRTTQVTSILFSEMSMPDQVKMFEQYFSQFCHKFIILKEIQFLNTSTVLSNIPECVSFLSIKTYLRTNDTDELIANVLSHQDSYLTHLKVDGFYVFRSINTKFPVLRRLTIGYCSMNEFQRLIDFSNASITHLKIFLHGKDDFNMIDFKQSSTSLIDFNVSFPTETSMSLQILKEFIEQLVNLKSLTIEATGSLDLMDGQQWEEYLYKKRIKKFNFKFTLSDKFTCYENKTSVLASFRSPFWLEQLHCYVLCENGESISSRPLIYTIPYFQSETILYPPSNIVSATTNKTELIYKYCHTLLLRFHDRIPIPIVPFPNIRSLKLLTTCLPSIELIQSIIYIENIRELDVSLVEYVSCDEFQMLIDKMINLKIIKMRYDPQFIPPLHIDSYIIDRQDRTNYVVDSNTIKRFSYLFFHVRNLEIIVESKQIIIQLLNQLHYLETVIFLCNQDNLSNIQSNWLLENVSRLNKIKFTYRKSPVSLVVSIGSTKFADNEREVTRKKKRKPVKCSWYKSCFGRQAN